MRIIAGEARGRMIEAPAGLRTRPTLDRVRENLFNMIQNDVPGSRVLDLFAGSGALSLEAISRGASFAVLADIDRNAYAVQKKNITTLHYENKTRQLRCDWRSAVRTLLNENERFDLVFLDPPYEMTDLREVFSMMMLMIGPESIIVLEHEAGKDPLVSEKYQVIKDRAWGFCAVTMYRLMPEGV